MEKQKCVAAIHDISGFGKCSLTVALPILSAAGIETSVLPTAVLSTHTGGFTGFTFRDLTADLKPFAAHWRSLELSFDCLYSGFLGSIDQLDIVSEIFGWFRKNNAMILVDPAMADNGRLYSTFSPDFVRGMAAFCAGADLIVPNMTEAAFLLGESYQPGPYDKPAVERILRNLSAMGPQQVVLTGVWFGDEQLGAAVYDRDTGETSYAFHKKIDGLYHGTGDVFASALLGALLNGFTLTRAAQIAVDFTANSIERTLAAGTDARFGVKFEQELPGYIRRLGLI